MGGTKITRQRDGKSNSKHKYNSPNGWTDRELNGQHENNSPKDGKSRKNIITRQKMEIK